MRVKVIAVGMGDEEIADGGEIDARPCAVKKGIGREVDAKLPVHEDLRARTHLFAAPLTDGAAVVTVTEERGDAFRRARPEKLDVHK